MSSASNDGLIHEVLPVGMLKCNCSILGDPETREAIVVDPGDETDALLEILRRHKLKVMAIVSTHTHIDHVGGLAKLHEVTGAPVFIHENDLELYKHLDLQAQWLGVETPATTKIEKFLREGDALKWGGFSAEVLHTPGHTPGSLCLYLPGGGDAQGAAKAEKKVETPMLIAGDTLFAGSIGRTDLWGGSMQEILRSLHNKLMKLPDETVVTPGHGEKTTIGEERQSNPFLKVR